MNWPTIYDQLLRSYGAQHWWPAGSAFEMMVGAILTQNTSWRNVELAIGELRAAKLLTPEAIAGATPRRVAQTIKSSGSYNVKAKRLKAYSVWYLANGPITALQRVETGMLRARLLAVHGIGPETADAILLYSFERPVFVIDAYTRRLCVRLGTIDGGESYTVLQSIMVEALPADTKIYNEFHALIVRHAKDRCRKQPLCEACCLAAMCAYSLAGS